MNISYESLAKAVSWYNRLGYEFIEVPWIVSYESHSSTASPPDGAFVVEGRGCLVGSAEQGFIEIMQDLEPNKKYAAISPCFRKNDNKDEYHQETFMKLELFSYNSDKENDHTTMIEDARKTFDYLGLPKVKINYIQSLFDDSRDLYYSNILELGSYGNRVIYKNNVEYIINYGTGLALPRFTQAIKIHREHVIKELQLKGELQNEC
jgi:hypothetical protein